MSARHQYFVYIMSNRTRRLYIGVTNDLERRFTQHKTGAIKGFASRYHINRLVYVEETNDFRAAISRERQLKGWVRARKINLINTMNEDWNDISDNW